MIRARRSLVAAGAGLAALAIALGLWGARTVRGTLPRPASSDAPLADTSALSAPSSAAPRAAVVAAAPDARPLLDAAELRNHLAKIQEAYAAGDTEALRAWLATLVDRPEQMRAVATWLASQDAARSPEACLGAFVALEAAIALYERDAPRFGRAGAELVEQLLDGLSALEDDLQARTIRMLQRVRGPKGAVLDLRFLQRILGLRATHPEIAERFVPLLASLAQGLDGDARREDFQRLFLEGQDDPLLVKCALNSLLASAPETFLPLAEDLIARHAEDARLCGAVAQAIAASAPVEDATRALVHVAGEGQYGAFATLGTRAGAGEAIAREYDALLAESANPVARKLLVSTMSSERAEVLVGIARIDPDPMVGLQAALTLSVRGELEPARFAEVRELFSSGGHLASGAALVAENVLLRSSGSVRESARAWLVELVRDPRAAESARLDAFGRVRRWVEPGAFAGVVIGGRALE